MKAPKFDTASLMEVENKLPDVINELFTVQRSRSDYVLSQFVVMQHDTPGHQRMQVLEELRGLIFAILEYKDEREAELEILEYNKKQGTAPSTLRKLRKSQRTILSLELAIATRMREVQTLFRILETLPKVSPAEYEAEEPEYWRRRLTRQMSNAKLAALSGLGEGNIEAFLQTLEIVGQRRREAPDQITPLLRLLEKPPLLETQE